MGYGVILTRQIARLERSLVQMLFNNCFFLVLTGIACAVSWHQLSADEMWLLLLVGVLGGFGQFCLFESAQHAPASLTAPLEYTALVWAFILGFLVWGDSPRPGVFIGAGLILSAGLLLLMMDERIRNSAFRYRWVGRAGWRQARPVRAGLAEGPATQATPVSRTKKTVIEGRAP